MTDNVNLASPGEATRGATGGAIGRFSRAGVIGLGTMGAGVVEVLSRAGLMVVGIESDQERASAGLERVRTSVARAVSRGKLDQSEATELLSRFTVSTSLNDLAEVDLVVEAVPERLELKRAVFAALDTIVSPDAVLATNTSSLSVTQIAVATASPSRVVGMHFFNPAPVQPLVEVIRTVVSSDSVIADVAALARSMGKQAVVIGDQAGFIANALLFGYLNHAAAMFDARYASREDIDTAMKLGCGYPMGPLALLDLIGLDTSMEILDTMYHSSRDRLHAPVPVLKQLVTAGLLGRKSGRGFYTYAAPGSSQVTPDAQTPDASDAAVAGARPLARAGVVGSGTMAAGIAEVLARGGLDVVLVARSAASADSAIAHLERSLERSVNRGRMSHPDRDTTLARISTTTSLEDLDEVDLVVEAVVEDLGIKTGLFAELDRITRPGTLLSTTTSSLPVVAMAAATKRPQDVVGLHFFNPAAVMKLVEVVTTVSTAPDALATARQVARIAGKTAVVCPDRAGFIVNALLFPYLNDAVRMLERAYASADDIDAAMRMGCGLPMGPFELLDVVGLDVSLAIQRTLYLEYREPGYAPAPMLENLVTAGFNGRKSGRGFRTSAGS